MTSKKYNAQAITHLLKEFECENIVIAPGSRNAPFIFSLGSDKYFNIFSAGDERSAAFLALGMAKRTKKPAAVICSSGSAVLNFYPAVVEAYYLSIPLILISADRPPEFIDKRMGQTIRQENIFEQHIRYQANLICEPEDKEKSLNYNLVSEGLKVLQSPKIGPIHFNVPFDEPLYERTPQILSFPSLEYGSQPRKAPEKFELEVLQSSSKVMLLHGLDENNDEKQSLLKSLAAKGVLILNETLSNNPLDESISQIDQFLESLSDEELGSLKPDLLISIGGELVSKKIKAFLRSHQPEHHWMTATNGDFPDTFDALSWKGEMDEIEFLCQLDSSISNPSLSYKEHYLAHNERFNLVLNDFVSEIEFSDLKVFSSIYKTVDKEVDFHYANSTSVRYSQLFRFKKEHRHYSNRGTSGIDGCTSTALGMSIHSDRENILISGDIAFLYDVNALWNKLRPSNFKIIIINNGGGNIFKLIDGPSADDPLMAFQETPHDTDFGGIAQAHGICYLKATNEAELNKELKSFFSLREMCILEIETESSVSPKVLKEMFKKLKSQ